MCLIPLPFTCGPEVQAPDRTGATPYFRFCLRAQAARIQTSVRLHTLFSGEPLGDPALQHAALSRPVRERRAGRGGDFFPFCPDHFFLRLRSFDSFTRSADLGAFSSARRSGSGPCVAGWWPWIDSTVIFFFFFLLSDFCLDQVEKTVSNLRLFSSFTFHPASLKSARLQMSLHLCGL